MPVLFCTKKMGPFELSLTITIRIGNNQLNKNTKLRIDMAISNDRLETRDNKLSNGISCGLISVSFRTDFILICDLNND